MKKLILIMALCTQSVVYSQSEISSNVSERNEISVSEKVSEYYKPDYFEVEVKISGYREEGENSRELKYVRVKDVEGKLYNELKEYNIDSNICIVKNINDFNKYSGNDSYKVIRKTISFKVQSKSKLEKIYENLNFEGMISINSKSFYSDSTFRKIENELIQIAAKRASEKAQSLLKAFGKNIGEIIKISSYDNMTYQQFDLESPYYNNQNNIESNIRNRKFSYTVSVVYEIK